MVYIFTRGYLSAIAFLWNALGAAKGLEMPPFWRVLPSSRHPKLLLNKFTSNIQVRQMVWTSDAASSFTTPQQQFLQDLGSLRYFSAGKGAGVCFFPLAESGNEERKTSDQRAMLLTHRRVVVCM